MLSPTARPGMAGQGMGWEPRGCDAVYSRPASHAPRQLAAHAGLPRRPVTLPLHARLQEYVRVFEPLLLEECAAQMLRGQEEGQVLTSQACGGTW